MELNKIYNESNLETMGRMPDCFVDLTVTSPPYDNMREYKGFSFPFEDIAKELYRVTKEGGVLVWVVGDSVIDGTTQVYRPDLIKEVNRITQFPCSANGGIKEFIYK